MRFIEFYFESFEDDVVIDERAAEQEIEVWVKNDVINCGMWAYLTFKLLKRYKEVAGL